jgi:uncharacterized protein YdiU (UPF0061 family)
VHFPFDNSYVRLPAPFHAAVQPTAVAAPRLLKLNRALAVELGLDPDALETTEAVEVFAGNKVPDGAEPVALAYAGHQFANFVPALGDGRAILLGEVIDRNGQRRDIQLKGSGPTPFSRRGDGRAAIGPVLREYLISEAMHALGIPTTRSLAAVATGEPVWRETQLPGAVLTRVAASHVRIGTFQYFAARGDVEATRTLADYVIARHYPELAGHEDRYTAFFDAVIGRQASLIAQWLHVGFIHGVMNTDNMTVSGETIDYGPCAFMDAHDPNTVFSSIDRQGRYSYGNQPGIAQWNLTRLAECLLPLLDENTERGVEKAEALIGGFAKRFNDSFVGGLRRKLGLATAREGDAELARDLLQAMFSGRADFTLTFRRLADAVERGAGEEGVRELFETTDGLDAWLEVWRARLAEEGADGAEVRERMRSVNPAYIPRNHRVEMALMAAAEGNDLRPFEEMLDVLSRPFEDQPGREAYALPPPQEQRVYQTFCGT